MMSRIIYPLIIATLFSCSQESQVDTSKNHPNKLKVYRSAETAQVMVLGTYHFAQESETDELSDENQAEIDNILNALMKFQPTKVVIEIEPKFSQRINESYQEYKKGSFSIDSLSNEIYQFGFKMADRMEHDSIYLFDDQTPFIGSLEGFSFQKFNEYAIQRDSSFTHKHLDQIMSTFRFNDSLLKTMPLFDRIQAINSASTQKINAQRMHMYEVRAGIGDNWIGPDWLGRWYQRNIRMMGNLLKLSKPEDRLLVIVGDNHKWILEDLMNYTPDFEVVSAFEYLEID